MNHHKFKNIIIKFRYAKINNNIYLYQSVIPFLKFFIVKTKKEQRTNKHKISTLKKENNLFFLAVACNGSKSAKSPYKYLLATIISKNIFKNQQIYLSLQARRFG
jgi:hypothetical protein